MSNQRRRLPPSDPTIFGTEYGAISPQKVLKRLQQSDRRRTCYCGHRYNDHAPGGTHCLGFNAWSGRPCDCGEWWPNR